MGWHWLHSRSGVRRLRCPGYLVSARYGITVAAEPPLRARKHFALANAHQQSPRAKIPTALYATLAATDEQDTKVLLQVT
jgi:hypothetical protein